jgi:hypothetical protein
VGGMVGGVKPWRVMKFRGRWTVDALDVRRK